MQCETKTAFKETRTIFKEKIFIWNKSFEAGLRTDCLWQEEEKHDRKD